MKEPPPRIDGCGELAYIVIVFCVIVIVGTLIGFIFIKMGLNF